MNFRFFLTMKEEHHISIGYIFGSPQDHTGIIVSIGISQEQIRCRSPKNKNFIAKLQNEKIKISYDILDGT